jgi:sugar phosphate isomerase/epimerase
MGSIRRQVLWSAGIAPTSLSERIEAAALNGYEILTITPDDYEQAAVEGCKPAELQRRAADRGVDLAVLDGLIEWHPHDPPKRPLGNSQFNVDDVLRIGEAFGISSINALAPYPTSLATEDLAEHFAALCDRAADHGWRVHLEFTPRSPVSDVSTAAGLIGLADRANGGILFDTWHFFRVDPDFDKLGRIAGDRIFAVQVSDGAAEFEEGLLADTFRHRRLPGHGVFDLHGVLAVLDAIGGLRLVGPEVLSVELFDMPAAEAARLAAESLDRVLDDFAAAASS